MKTTTVLALSAAALAASAAHAQLTLEWSTVDGGGGTLGSGPLTLEGTIGQPDAGALGSGALTLSGGFWAGGDGAPPCYPNCDGSTSQPALNAIDFGCFLNRYQQALALPAAQQASAYANCDGSTSLPVLNALDFGCFLTRYRAGCP